MFALYGVSPNDAEAVTRQREYVYPRMIMAYFMFRNSSMTYKQLGQRIATIIGRDKPYDHATIIHYVREIQKFLTLTDPESQKITNIVHEINKSLLGGVQIRRPLKTPIPESWQNLQQK